MRISDGSSDVCSSDLQAVIRDDRHDEFAAARGIAGDVAGKGEDVVDALARAQPRRGAAHALVERDADARGLALKGAEDEFGPELRRRALRARGGQYV